jgi:hypothetical protein
VTKIRLGGFFLLLLVVTVNATAGIYKWVDENGQVQFGDRPPAEAATSDEVVIRNQRAPVKTAPVDRNEARDRLLEQYQRERAEKKEAAAKMREEKRQRAARCNYARGRVTRYLESGSLYRYTANRERKYLTDQERDAALARARADVKKWCK